MLRRMKGLLIAAVLCLCMIPTAGYAQESRLEIGNSDLNILNGGVMLDAGDDFYFVQDGGIFVQSGEKVRAVSGGAARNLNLYGGYLYYTENGSIRRVPASGGASETVFEAERDIKQLYIVNGVPEYLSGGAVYELPGENENPRKISGVSGIEAFIPTPYGIIYMTGETFEYTLWVNGRRILTGVSSCYTDNGYLAVQIDNHNYMARLTKIFGSFDAAEDLEDFNIHGTVLLSELLSPDDENAVSEDNDNNELQCNFRALLEEAGLCGESASLLETDPAETDTATAVPEVSEGQKNIVKRARQLTEIRWTPLEDITQWGSYGTFKAETTYTGIPYGQPVNCNGYIGYGVTLEDFASAALDNTSRLYTEYSHYNKISPCMATDCSGYVSYAWGLKNKKTTHSLPEVAELVGDQSVYSLQVGDCLDKPSSHTVLISSLDYDADGSIVGLQVMEQTPVITRVTNYGRGQAKSLASFQSYYLNGGYSVYRNPDRDGVTYTPSTAVPLDGEAVAGQKDPAPKERTVSFVGGKRVTLSSDNGGDIFYTLDGSVPTTGGTRYTGAITLYDTVRLRAIAATGNFSGSTILEYTVKVPQAETPETSVSSGMCEGKYVSSGSHIELGSTEGASIYYTLDGTQPTTSGRSYTSPITLTKDTTIKAIAAGTGMKQSETMAITYKIGEIYDISAAASYGGSISPRGVTEVLSTGSASYTIEPDDGYAIKDVLVDGVSVGAASSYTFKDVSSDHSISASFEYLGQLPFTDVNEGQWFGDAAAFVYARGLFKGTSATLFSPDMTMTRGMFVTVLGRFAGLPSDLTPGVGLVTAEGVNIRSGPSTDTEVAGFITEKNTTVRITSVSGSWYGVVCDGVPGYIRNDLVRVYDGNYSDLDESKYYSPYAEWAYLTGIADGAAGEVFNAEGDITREHMCMLLYNYASVYGKTLPKTDEKSTFTDDASISAGAKAAVYALRQAGVINGMGDGTFSPQGTATRAQVAQIFMKFANAVG